MGFGGAGPSSSIASSSDVALNTLASNQTLTYNTTTSKWGNATLTKASVGLTNVDDTADIDKPVSTAVQTALNTTVQSSNGTILNDIVVTQAAYDALVSAGTTVATTRYTIVG